MVWLGLRGKLSLALLLAVALTVGVTVWIALRTLTAFSTEETERGLATAQRTVERFLDLRQEVALGHSVLFASRDDVRDAIVARDRDALIRIGRRFMQEQGVDDVVITDASGVVLARAHAPAEYGDDGRGVPAVEAALRGTAVATIRRAPVVPLGVSGVAPVFERAPSYRLVGTVATGFALDGAFVAEVKRATGHDASLVVDDARLYTTLPGPGGPPPPGGEPHPSRVAIGDQSYRVIYGSLEGRYGGPVGRFEIAKSEASIVAARVGETRALVAAGAAVAAAVVTAGLWFSTRISAPLMRLARAAEAMARGERPASVVVERRDEIGTLGRAFDRMALEVTHAENALRWSEQEARRLFAETEVARERLETLSRRLIEVQESEHRQMARELHDGIGQALTAIKMNLEMLERRPESVPARLRETAEMAEQVLAQVRDLSLSLRPSVLDDLGLVAALRWHADRESRRAGLRLEFAADPIEPRPGPAVETACFRIAQEALANVVRHARAQSVSLRVRRVNGTLEMTIADDGSGFDTRAARRHATAGTSMGFLSMEERATLLGGRLEVESEPGKGTIVRASLPLTGGGVS